MKLKWDNVCIWPMSGLQGVLKECQPLSFLLILFNDRIDITPMPALLQSLPCGAQDTLLHLPAPCLPHFAGLYSGSSPSQPICRLNLHVSDHFYVSVLVLLCAWSALTIPCVCVSRWRIPAQFQSNSGSQAYHSSPAWPWLSYLPSVFKSPHLQVGNINN